MLIYHTHCNTDIGSDKLFSDNKNKNRKKGYKSATKRKQIRHSSICVEGGETKKSKVLRKKEISEKNIQYLEGLGLKVKQKH